MVECIEHACFNRYAQCLRYTLSSLNTGKGGRGEHDALKAL
jgi:hypothetical protein